MTQIEQELDEKTKDEPAPYTSIDGNEFSFLGKEGTLGLNLSNAKIEAFMAKHNVPRIEQSGSAMEDHVSIPHPVLDDQKHLEETFAKPSPAKTKS